MAATLNYQVLMNAVTAATSISSAYIFPNDYDYVALPLSTVRQIVTNFQPGQWRSEVDDCDDKARRLWHMFKEHHTLAACGMIRLSSPVAHDIVGIVTVEDLMAAGLGGDSAQQPDLKAPKKGIPDVLRDDLLNDDIADEHFSGTPVIPSPIAAIPSEDRSRRDSTGRRDRRERGDRNRRDDSSGGGVEMTLIEPRTKYIFKRSQGGYFGSGWPVSNIKAFAVWF